MAYSAIDNRIIDNQPRPVIIKCGDVGLRDYFAGQALAGMLADTSFNETREETARRSYAMADEMIAERSKT